MFGKDVVGFDTFVIVGGEVSIGSHGVYWFELLLCSFARRKIMNGDVDFRL
jgi:hypothetical protein